MATLNCPVCDEPFQQGDLLCMSCGANLARAGGAQRGFDDQQRGFPPPPGPQGGPQYGGQPEYGGQQQPQYGGPPAPPQGGQQYGQGPDPYQQQGPPQPPGPPGQSSDPWGQPPQPQPDAWGPPMHQQGQGQQQHGQPSYGQPPQQQGGQSPDPWGLPQQQPQQQQQQQDPWGAPQQPPMPDYQQQPEQQFPPPQDQYAPQQDQYAPQQDQYGPPQDQYGRGGDQQYQQQHDQYGMPPQGPGDNQYGPPQSGGQPPMPPPHGREATLLPPDHNQGRQPDSTAFMCPYCEAVLSHPGAAQCDSCLRPLPQKGTPVLRVMFPTGELKVSVGQHLVIGRDAGQSPVASTFTQYDNVSRRHSTVWLDPSGTAWVRDEGSTNGTFVNGERLPRGVEAPLRDGDQLRLAADVTGTVQLN